MGLYNHHKSNTTSNTVVPGCDACGIIVEAGPSSSWKVGDRVMSIFNQSHQTGQVTAEDMKTGLGSPLPGVLTTHRIFPDYGLVKAPDYLSDEEAATMPIAPVTAWMSLNGLVREVSKEDIVLIQGTGGVSIAGLQIAAAAGARGRLFHPFEQRPSGYDVMPTVIVTSSSDEKLKRAKKLGATDTINYRTTPNWEEEVLRLTDGNGATRILECGGAKTLRQSFECLSFGGHIACIGYLSGKQDDGDDRLNTNVLALKKNASLQGILNGPKDKFEEVCRFFEKHQIHPVIDRVFPFEKADKALQYLFSGQHFGKVIVKVKQ